MRNVFSKPVTNFLSRFPARTHHVKWFSTLTLLVITAGLFLFSVHPLSAQIQRDTTKLGTITIPEQNSTWQIVQKTGVAARPPLELKDKSGKPIPPTQLIQLKSGRKVTAQQYFDELKKIEKQINRYGYGLRDVSAGAVKFAVPKDQALLNAQKTLEPSQGEFLDDVKRKSRNATTKPVGNLTLKPINEYSTQEYDNVRKKYLHVKENNVQLAATAEGPRAAPGTLLKQFNSSKTKSWSYGNKNIFQAALTASAKFTGKYYQPEGKEEDMNRDQIKAAIQNTNTEFSMTGTANATGYILGSSIQILDTKGEAYLPANKTKKAKVNVTAKLVGISVLNLNKEFTTDFNESGKKFKHHRWGKEFNTTILLIPLSGEIGVKGEVGFEYTMKGTIPYTVSASCRPYASLAGYAEVSLDVWAAEAGVSANLIFIKGELNIDGTAGIVVWNNVLVFANVNAVYKLEFLSGNLSIYVEIGWDPFSYRYDWVIWEWSGAQRTGNFLDLYSLNVYNW